MHPLTPGYLDAAAGLPLHPIAVEAMQAALDDGWADPSRLTGPSRRSAVLLNAAREAVADCLAVHPDEISFVPSGVQAMHLAVLGSLAGRKRAGRCLVHSAVEHSAVFTAARWHRASGGEIDVVPVDSLGRVDVEQFVSAATQAGVATAVLQAANHEVGTTQPVDRVASELAERGIPMVVDASHTLVYGSPPRDAPIFTGDARFWGGPAGAGILVVRRGARWKPPFPTDEAEFGRSAGVVNIPAIVAGAASLRAVWANRATVAERLSDFVSHIRAQVPLRVPDAVVLGDPDGRLPHIVTFSCLYVEGEALLTALDRRGFAVSSGSSCTSDTLTPSHVLVAMGALTSGNVRVSLHAGVTEDEISRFLTVLAEVVAEVRAQNPGRPAAPVQLQTTRTTDHEPADTSPKPSQNTDESPPQMIDSRGRRCPLPVLDLAQNLGRVEVGDQVTVLADDPAAAGDLAAWCRMRGHLLVSSSTHSGIAMAHVVRRLH